MSNELRENVGVILDRLDWKITLLKGEVEVSRLPTNDAKEVVTELLVDLYESLIHQAEVQARKEELEKVKNKLDTDGPLANVALRTMVYVADQSANLANLDKEITQ